MAPKDQPQPDVTQVIDALQRLLDMFKLERRVYLGVTISSVVILIVVAGFLLFSSPNGQNWDKIFAMFVPGGAFAFTGSQLLRMWNQAFGMIQATLIGKIDND